MDVPGITLFVVTNDSVHEGVGALLAVLVNVGHIVEVEIVTTVVVGWTTETDEVTIVCVDCVVCTWVVVKVGTTSQDEAILVL